jgi:hypothetical protein
MPRVRETIARFIEGEGHKVDATPVDPGTGESELLFRSRGQVFSVTTTENDAGVYSISTAYEVPDWAREQTTNADTLARVSVEHEGVNFSMAHDGSLFVATLDEKAGSPEGFTHIFWELVNRVREAGQVAIERIVDRTESKFAAEKFINSFMLGDQ